MLWHARRGLITGRGALDAAAAAGYTAQGANFDGTNDWLARAAGLTGASDSQSILVSFWVRFNGGDGNFQEIWEDDSQNTQISRNNSNKMFMQWTDSLGFSMVAVTSTSSLTAASGWTHVLMAAQAGGGDPRFLYINDAADLASSTFDGSKTIDFTRANWYFGSRNGSLLCNADFADVYINFGAYLDISNSTNRRKFITAGLRPVDLGSDGSTPTGTAPIVYFSSATASWHTNKGSGGGFTLTGALTSSSSNP